MESNNKNRCTDTDHVRESADKTDYVDVKTEEEWCVPSTEKQFESGINEKPAFDSDIDVKSALECEKNNSLNDNAAHISEDISEEESNDSKSLPMQLNFSNTTVEVTTSGKFTCLEDTNGKTRFMCTVPGCGKIYKKINGIMHRLKGKCGKVYKSESRLQHHQKTRQYGAPGSSSATPSLSKIDHMSSHTIS